MQPNPTATFVRFMRMVNIQSQKGSCWLWTGNAPGGRHGHFSLGHKAVKAHRWIYELLHGPIPDGLLVRHRCDNPKCVNPEHLEVGTSADNTADMFSRGRAPNRQGELHPLACLSASQVSEIRRLSACGLTQATIAKEFNISRQHVGKIVRRENWSHVQ